MKIFSALILAALLVSSCASDEDSKSRTEAELLYNEAKTLVEDGRYLQATEYLNQIRSQHPYSYYATHAELQLADIYFLQENFVEAAAAYTVFRDLHPKHKKISYVLFRIAESYYMQRPSSIDRDLEPCLGAIKYFYELLQKYPRSAYTKDAIKKVNTCKGMIEGREQYIADFYFKTENFSAARYRCLDVIKNYDTKDLKNHCVELVLKASLKLNEKKECVKYYHQLKGHVSKKGLNSVNVAYKNCQ